MFHNLFTNPKPIMAMLHLKGESPEERLQRAEVEARVYMENGIDAMIVEDYFGDASDVERVIEHLRTHHPEYMIGVNVLDDFLKSFQLARDYELPFLQVDSICGHLTQADEINYFEQVDEFRKNNQIIVIGGVRFKYQPILSERSLYEDLHIGMMHCDAIAVTGAGTGLDTDTGKVSEFRSIIGEFPLVVAAGMTKDTIKDKLSIADAAIVGSTFKNTRQDTGDVYADHVREFMDEVIQLFRS